LHSFLYQFSLVVVVLHHEEEQEETSIRLNRELLIVSLYNLLRILLKIMNEVIQPFLSLLQRK
jgi:hypothetical protein